MCDDSHLLHVPGEGDQVPQVVIEEFTGRLQETENMIRTQWDEILLAKCARELAECGWDEFGWDLVECGCEI